jgi:phosphoribosylaminoimidazole (AIR) synthetase
MLEEHEATTALAEPKRLVDKAVQVALRLGQIEGVLNIMGDCFTENSARLPVGNQLQSMLAALVYFTKDAEYACQDVIREVMQAEQGRSR